MCVHKQTKVLGRCKRPELRPALQALRDLFFTPGYVYRTDVSPAEFIEICDQHMGHMAA
jgi:hypothetical protein